MTTHGWYHCPNCGRPVDAQDDSGRRDLCARCGGPATGRLESEARSTAAPGAPPDPSQGLPQPTAPRPRRRRT